MTYQPPSPPPAGGPPMPPPSSSPGGFDPKTINPLDWAIIGIGVVVLLFSFFDYITGPGGSVGAWHLSGGTFLTWFAMVFAVAAAAFVAIELLLPQVELPIPSRAFGLGLFALSFVLYFLGIFVHPDFFGVLSHGFSFWFSLILAAAGAVLSLIRVQQTGTALPGVFASLPNLATKVNVGKGAAGARPGAPAGGYRPPAPGSTTPLPPPGPGYGPPR